MLELQTKTLVVGCTLEALEYAVQEDALVVFSKPEPPHFLDNNKEFTGNNQQIIQNDAYRNA